MDGQNWPSWAVKWSFRVHRASTSGENMESFVFPWKNSQFWLMMTWLLASKMIRYNAKFVFKSFLVVILHFISNLCLLWNALIPRVWCTRLAFCRPSLAVIVKILRCVWCVFVLALFNWSCDRFFVDFHKSSFSPVKMAIRSRPSRIYLHLEGFKLPLWGTPVAHQIVAGNSISVTWGSNGSVPTMACFRYCFCWPSLVRFVEFIVFPQEN